MQLHHRSAHAELTGSSYPGWALQTSPQKSLFPTRGLGHGSRAPRWRCKAGAGPAEHPVPEQSSGHAELSTFCLLQRAESL